MSTKRTGKVTFTSDGKKLSGGAFAHHELAENKVMLDSPTSLEPIDPQSAFSLFTEEFEGNDSDWSVISTFKPSPEAARRLRSMFDLPPGNAKGIAITEEEYESGDGWASDSHEHYVDVQFRDETLIVLDGDEPMERLRKRVAHSHRDWRAEAQALVGREKHERWVKMFSDREKNPWPSIQRIDLVLEDRLLTTDLRGNSHEWMFHGDSNFMLRFSREEALEQRPNLAFTESSPFEDAKSQAANHLHQHWLDEYQEPVMVSWRDYVESSENPTEQTGDARELGLEFLYSVNGTPHITNTLKYIASNINSAQRPPTAAEIDQAALEASQKIKTYEQSLERYYGQPRPSQWAPISDPRLIAETIRMVWEEHERTSTVRGVN